MPPISLLLSGTAIGRHFASLPRSYRRRSPLSTEQRLQARRRHEVIFSMLPLLLALTREAASIHASPRPRRCSPATLI